VVVVLFAASPALIAAESTEFAKMGRTVWAAFECSSLASVLKKPKDQERLFRFGYEQGREFLHALQGGQITAKDLNSITPSGFLLVAQGPTADFILGRVFESAQENALKDVITTESVLHKDLQQAIALRKYTSGNCVIIGK
jgi:hypothetical protein